MWAVGSGPLLVVYFTAQRTDDASLLKHAFRAALTPISVWRLRDRGTDRLGGGCPWGAGRREGARNRWRGKIASSSLRSKARESRW